MRKIVVFLAVLGGGCFLEAVLPQISPEAVIRPGVGLVKFDLFGQYLGTASGGEVPGEITLAMARKSIVDAGQLGIPYFRVAASGYSPRDLDLWLYDPEKYWRRFDQMLADLSEYHLQIIPSIAWWIRQFPLVCQEGVRAFFTDEQSCSQQLFYRYVNDLVGRYQNHPAILFWEIGNEWNLDADLDLDRRWKMPGNNFTTSQLIAFTKKLGWYLHEIDPVHLVSSGFGGSRRCAEHLRRQPEWSPEGPDWTDDSPAEYAQNILDLHQGLDIISAHPYNLCENADCPRRDNERFGLKGKDNAGLLNIVKSIADSSGKLLFIGEFGDSDPHFIDDPEGRFTQSILGKIVELEIPFSAVWGWEFYQNAPYIIASDDSYRLEPGFTDFILNRIKETNERLGWPMPVREDPDRTPPMVIMTFPFQGARISEGQIIHAVASDNYGVERVEFWLGAERLAVLDRSPYQITLSVDRVSWFRGWRRLTARAFDRAGNESRSIINVWFSPRGEKFVLGLPVF